MVLLLLLIIFPTFAGAEFVDAVDLVVSAFLLAGLFVLALLDTLLGAKLFAAEFADLLIVFTHVAGRLLAA